MHSVLFVCLGNICRSPLAEAAFREAAAHIKMNAHIDSAGTGNWHVGRAPDPRSIAVAAQHGIDIGGYKARQVAHDDFYNFTHIIALDRQNLADLKNLAPDNATASLSLLLDQVEGRAGQSVADPYYGDTRDFDVTWADVTAGAKGLVRALQSRKG
jgi:protein-tyrosine phosphatase